MSVTGARYARHAGFCVSALKSNNKFTVGWREWVALPELGLAAVKAKVDTGARTSALHAFQVDRFSEAGAPWARLHIHPQQHNQDTVVVAEAAIIDEREVTDSGGHREKRIVISTTLSLAEQQWPIEVTVTDRDSMLFRMLLGRTAMRGHIVVDPSKSFYLGRGPGKTKARNMEPKA